jgi:hypothetical protein
VTALADAATAARPWRRAAFWLAFLAPFFYLTYGTANWLAAGRADVGAVVFGWERQLPFLAWTIVPYWSINAFYALSLFVCADRAELDRHGRRLVTAQVVAVLFFVLAPLRFTFARPETDGLPGFLFAVLGGFDKPFNQAPSLHIALLVILWDLYARHVPAAYRWALHLWFVLIGLSVLTTYQHHFVDLPTGALLGLLCLWLWPEGSASPLRGEVARDRRRRSLAACYLAGAAAAAALAFSFGGWALPLLWPAVSLTLVAVCYAFAGPAGFGKRADGTVPLATRILFAPYTLSAWANSRLWTRTDPAPAPIADGVWLGRAPAARDLGCFAAVVDLAAELPLARDGATRVTAVPMLDLVAPPADRLAEAAAAIERLRPLGPVLVACALGYSRSAAAVATWLVSTGRARDAAAAEALIRAARPPIVLDETLLRRVAEAGAAARPAIGSAA